MSQKFLYCAILLGVLLLGRESSATPYTPLSDSEIVEKLPAGSRSGRRLMYSQNIDADKLERQLETAPDEAKKRISEARNLIDLARREGDPRSLAYAESRLEPLVSDVSPHSSALVLLATIQQSRHNFAAAEKTLQRAIEINGDDAQAWLTRAMIFRAQGKFDDARKACAPLLRTADEFTLTLCAASVRALSGHAKDAYRVLSEQLNRQTDAPISLQVWAHTLLAEIAEQIGDDAAAARHYSNALVFEKQDAYLLASYADFFLRLNKPRSALALLQGRGLEKHDGLLLRLALAAQAAGLNDDFVAYKSELQNRIDSARLRGDSVHLREEAIFELELRGDARQALNLARKNFETQRELADASILVKCAQAVGEKESAEGVRRWLTANHVEDVRLKIL